MGPNNIFLNYHSKHTMGFLVKQDSFVGWVGLSLSLFLKVALSQMILKDLYFPRKNILGREFE